jgi:hypothetical protein
MTGGCLCGAVRYEVPDAPRGTTLCHCEDCRRASGAPAVAWTFFTGDGPCWTKGSPALLPWAGRERTFCARCGTPLSFYDPGLPGQFEVTTCSLDEPGTHAVQDHNWVEDRLPWFDTRDDTPRRARNTPP